MDMSFGVGLHCAEWCVTCFRLIIVQRPHTLDESTLGLPRGSLGLDGVDRVLFAQADSSFGSSAF